MSSKPERDGIQESPPKRSNTTTGEARMDLYSFAAFASFIEQKDRAALEAWNAKELSWARCRISSELDPTDVIAFHGTDLQGALGILRDGAFQLSPGQPARAQGKPLVYCSPSWKCACRYPMKHKGDRFVFELRAHTWPPTWNNHKSGDENSTALRTQKRCTSDLSQP